MEQYEEILTLQNLGFEHMTRKSAAVAGPFFEISLGTLQ